MSSFYRLTDKELRDLYDILWESYQNLNRTANTPDEYDFSATLYDLMHDITRRLEIREWVEATNYVPAI